MTEGSQEAIVGQANHPLERVWTLPNIITFIRFGLIPIFFALLLSGYTVQGFIIFVVAASTDWVDGQIARRTNSVSLLGQVLDPFVDRFLIGYGIVSVFLTGSAPIWIAVLLIMRDMFLLCITVYLRHSVPGYKFRVSYVGKVTTALLFIGFASCMLSWPMWPGLGIAEISWLPGLGEAPASMGIFVIYVALILSLVTAGIYVYRGRKVLAEAKSS